MLFIQVSGSFLSPSKLLNLKKRILIESDVKDIQITSFTILFVNLTNTVQQEKIPDLFPVSHDYFDDVAKADYNTLCRVIKGLEKPPKGMCLVVPRFGTISPWSSKAVDIVKSCSLEKLIDCDSTLEKGIVYFVHSAQSDIPSISKFLHDRMTQNILFGDDTFTIVKEHYGGMRQNSRKSLVRVALDTDPESSLQEANKRLGLALNSEEIAHLIEFGSTRDKMSKFLTDAELMMFSQVNSEHCRHKIFNSDWDINNIQMEKSLFDMIKETFHSSPEYILSAYSDNAAVLEGFPVHRFYPEYSAGHSYKISDDLEFVHIVCKVETHNHPTAICPFSGSATGVGGEIRDEGAVGRGSKPKSGLSGYAVSNLFIPDFIQPWEKCIPSCSNLSSALDIMINAPLGAASFNNEFGRPNLCGYFRTYCDSFKGRIRGFHKPIMIAGGMGTIQPCNVFKKKLEPGYLLIVLGGPSMLIGLGGGAASSMESGSSSAELDFASVQRENPEMERRCQEVIDVCANLSEQNPIQSIHDVGAGGISNALPEIVHESDCGALVYLRRIPSADSNLSPMEIWCNESQERYILSVKNDDLKLFKEICERERCPFAVVGTVTKDRNLVVLDELDNSHVVNIPMSVLFCSSKKGKRISKEFVGYKSIMCFNNYSLKEIVDRVLSLPTVASKSFLITIGDRSVTGLVSRDQMVGPWQVPISDVGVTCSSFMSKEGEAMAMGERPISALCNPSASARMALAEALLNIAAAKPRIETVRVSCNWMACPNFENDGSGLYYAVRSVSTLCKQLGVTIPVGKDSLSMSAKLDDGNLVVAPISLVVSAFSRIENVFHTLTPDLKRLKNGENTFLVFVDLAHGKQRLGGSCLAQVFNEIGDSVPDVESPEDILRFFKELNSTFEDNTVLAYHDKSDGGLFVTIAEMCFGGRIGAHCDLSHIASSTSVTEALFNEELGAVIQIRESDLLKIENLENYYILGKVGGYTIDISNNGLVESFDIFSLQRTWAETSYRIQSIRDNMDMALEEYDTLLDRNDPGLHFCLTYSHSFDVFEEKIIQCLSKPKVAILREQGINGAIEMAACFDRVGFQCVDVHMSDIISGDIQLDDFRGIVACGGFSFGDVLGAGIGWSKSVKMNQAVLSEFSRFFSRKETFALGICNGCQMLSNIVDGMPRFTRNKSDQFEARYSMVEIVESPATNVWFNGMVGSRLPIAVAHGEGRAVFESGTCNVAVRFVDNYGKVTERYPFNPNGSIKGSTGFSSEDGRILIMMPHPERVVRTSSMSWYPKNDQGVCEWGEGSDGFGDSPWIKMFQNVRLWTGA